jgi:hypothetical protein
LVKERLDKLSSTKNSDEKKDKKDEWII